MSFFIILSAVSIPQGPPRTEVEGSNRPAESRDYIDLRCVGTLQRYADGYAVGFEQGGTIPLSVSNIDLSTMNAAKKLVGKRVAIEGKLEWSSSERTPLGPGWICVTRSIVDASQRDIQKGTLPMKGAPRTFGRQELIERVRSSGEMLVVYRDGRADEATELCKRLGLQIKSTHGAGRLFVCRWPVGVNVEKAIDSLLASPAIQRIEPNAKMSIDDGINKPEGASPGKKTPTPGENVLPGKPSDSDKS